MNIEEQQNIILNFLLAGKYEVALNKSIIALKKNPANPNLYNMAGLAYFQLGDIEKAIQNFKSSLRLFPDNLSAITNMANAYKKKLDYKKAEELYLEGFNKNPNHLNNLVNFANFKMDINQVNESINIYKSALKINPDNHLVHFNLASAYKAVGDFNNAKVSAEKTLILKPDFAIADRLISTVTTYTNHDEDTHFLKLKKNILDDNLSPKNKVYTHFAIAKAYNDTQQFDKFFNHIEMGNKLKRDLIKYDFKNDLDLFNKIKLLFKDVNFNKIETKKNTKKLIFVLGMPRSGTSLVEQIISAHSDVFGAGELPFLQNSLFKKLHSLEINNIDKIFKDIDKITENYMKQVLCLNKNNQIILDKSPLNFLLIGFIRILFPNSKIIHIKRDSKDTCFSCYKNLFDHGLNFTYDKKELALYYNLYNDLMNFWNKRLGNFIYTINYETLVNDQKHQIENMLKFCNLNFEENCLKFYKNESPIKTVSAMQARKKIYNDSIQSYKLYEKDLTDIFGNLEV
jgi:tetratricopeptide (TPR) repeat protein